jgi:hypothetical protein
VNLLFFMSVILLKDGLHDLHAGTAGGGQVNDSPRLNNVFVSLLVIGSSPCARDWVLRSKDWSRLTVKETPHTAAIGANWRSLLVPDSMMQAALYS